MLAVLAMTTLVVALGGMPQMGHAAFNDWKPEGTAPLTSPHTLLLLLLLLLLLYHAERECGPCQCVHSKPHQCSPVAYLHRLYLHQHHH